MTEYYAKTETLSIEERRGFTDRKVKWIVKHAYENSPGMRAIMDKAGVPADEIKGCEDLLKFPIIDKEALVELQRQNPPCRATAATTGT